MLPSPLRKRDSHGFSAWGDSAITFVLLALAGELAMLIIYLFLLFSRLKRVVDSLEPLTPLQTIHAATRVLIFPLLFVSILIIGRFKRL
ncbi:MAG: hypothetical protein ACE5H0_11125 [Bacteroidota bacterium]